MTTMALGLLSYVVCLSSAIERPDRQTAWIACAYGTTITCVVAAVMGVTL